MSLSPADKPFDPVQEADDAARQLARRLLAQASHASLAYLDPVTAMPGISRIAFGLDPVGAPMTLVSALAQHATALRAEGRCAVMVGEVGEKGDPLTHPRLMIRARAQFIAADDPRRGPLRAHWLQSHPKAALYVDFADFAFVLLTVEDMLLNAGFGRAHRMGPEDLLARP